MEGINWDKAPEGATHYVTARGIMGGPWRKVTEDKVYAWVKNEWTNRTITTVAKYLEVNAKDLVARPVEAALPNGLQWPEGYDYYNPHGLNGFFFNEEEFVWNGQVLKWNIEVAYWKNHEATIHRYGKGVEVVAQPAPKKKVGWWG